MKSRFAAAAIVWLSAAPLLATPIENATSFSPSLTKVIDFSTPALTPTNYPTVVTLVDTQFAALGATFNDDFSFDNVTYNNNPSGDAIGNFVPIHGPIHDPPFTSIINFNVPLTGVEFALGASPQSVEVDAYLGATLVGTASGSLDSSLIDNIFGFVNESPFDSIRIQLDSGNGIFYLGNMHLSTPEPESFILLGIAGVGLCLAARRRRKA